MMTWTVYRAAKQIGSEMKIDGKPALGEDEFACDPCACNPHSPVLVTGFFLNEDEKDRLFSSCLVDASGLTC